MEGTRLNLNQDASGGNAKRREKKQKPPGKIFRKKSLLSVGGFVSRIIRSLGTFTHFGDVGPAARDPEDDDGGFRDGRAPCTLGANSGITTTIQNQNQNQSQDLDHHHHHHHHHPVQNQKACTALAAASSCSVREKLSWFYGDRTPGVLGLKNHGNTCFMNAVVQCLSNTDLLAEYLGLERYKMDLVLEEGGGGGGGGTQVRVSRGEVTEHLASLVRALWTLEYTPNLSVDFKTTVSKYGSQFRGNSQHDALEFLLWLLDRVHEDVSLSSCSNNNHIPAPGKNTCGAEEIISTDPSRSHAEHPGMQSSFVQEHFQAQYKSSLTCPHCLKQSNTFDPFLCISLPIPLRQTRPLSVTLVFSTKGQRYLRVGLAVPLFGPLSCLRRMVADQGNISPDQVILTEIYSTGFQRSFFDEEELTSVAENDVVYAFQAPPLYIRGGSARISGYHHSLPSSPYSSGAEGQRLPPSGTLSSEFLNQGVPAKILLLVCNAAGVGQQVVRFGPPFLMREDRAISWDQLQQSVLSKLYYLMINGAQAQNARVLFNIRVVGGSASYSYLSPQDGRPLYHPAVDRALKLCGSGGPPHVKLIIEWEHRVKDCLFGNIQEEVVKEADSVRAQQQQHVQQSSCTLDDCFQLYTKEEQLAPDDAWKCPHCQQLQQGVVQMSLWTLPDILILHLKRFRQVGERRNKLTTLVRFPLSGLDMAPHVVKRSLGGARQAPQPGWKQPRPPDVAAAAAAAAADFLYDLYAVCNHHGGMHGGHYTASCRNSVDGQWYSYDDSSAEPVPEAEVCTRGAYILFYQRRNTIPPWSASSSGSCGSTSSSASDHWLVRLRGSSERVSLGSEGSLSGPPGPTTALDSPELPVFRDEPPKNADTRQCGDGFEAKPFVRGSQARSVSMRSPTKPKDALSPRRLRPLRWSFAAKDRSKPPAPAQPGELVEYLESGRRPRCTKEPIISLVATPPLRKAQSRALELGRKELSCSLNGSICDSPKKPEGQSRPGTDRSNSLEHSSSGSCARTKDDGLPGQVSSKRARQDQGRTLDLHTHRGAILGGHICHSAPPSRDSTLRRNKVQAGLNARAQRDLLQSIMHPVDRRDLSGDEGKSHDSLLSFFKPGFMRKDARGTPSKVHDGRVNGQPGRAFSSGSAKMSLSNGNLTPATPEGDRKPKQATRAGDRNGRAQPISRKWMGFGPADIKRAHSSSSLQNRLDLTLHRCASLQRNGEAAAAVAAPHLRCGLASDKPGYAPLQHAQYSTTSLGRQATVPGVRF